MRRVAWALFIPAVALAPVGIALGVVGERRGLDLPPDRGSKLLVELVAAIAAMLFAAVGLLIARKESRNPIGWIFLGSGLTLALTAVAYGYADLALYGGEGWVAARLGRLARELGDHLRVRRTVPHRSALSHRPSASG